MDVIGYEPKNETGEYFRNNIWWWSGLWHFSTVIFEEMSNYAEHGVDEEILIELIEEGFEPNSPDNGYCNNGWGLNAEGARLLGEKLKEAVELGIADEAARQLMELKSETPLLDCNLCDATGIRTDAIGNELGMRTRKLDEIVAIVVGRTTGSCNVCHGLGRREAPTNNYQFSVENVTNFAEFCLASGGFSIH